MFQKYQKSAEDDFAGNYFKPKRATELLIQSHGESGRPFHKWKGIQCTYIAICNLYTIKKNDLLGLKRKHWLTST